MRTLATLPSVIFLCPMLFSKFQFLANFLFLFYLLIFTFIYTCTLNLQCMCSRYITPSLILFTFNAHLVSIHLSFPNFFSFHTQYKCKFITLSSIFPDPHTISNQVFSKISINPKCATIVILFHSRCNSLNAGFSSPKI